MNRRDRMYARFFEIVILTILATSLLGDNTSRLSSLMRMSVARIREDSLTNGPAAGGTRSAAYRRSVVPRRLALIRRRFAAALDRFATVTSLRPFPAFEPNNPTAGKRSKAWRRPARRLTLAPRNYEGLRVENQKIQAWGRESCPRKALDRVPNLSTTWASSAPLVWWVP